MFSSRKSLERRHSKQGTHPEHDAGVSFAITWRRSGWVLALVVASVIVARVLGFF